MGDEEHETEVDGEVEVDDVLEGEERNFERIGRGRDMVMVRLLATGVLVRPVEVCCA